MDTKTTSRNLLFDLPAELRNFVYRELARTARTQILKGSDRGIILRHQASHYVEREASIIPYIEPKLLLVNKQFKVEYEREIFKTALLRSKVALFSPIPGFLDFLAVPDYAFVNLRNVELTIKMMSLIKAKEFLNKKYALIRQCCFPALGNLDIQFLADIETFEYWVECGDLANGARDILDSVHRFSALCEATFHRARIDCGFFIETEVLDFSDNLNWSDMSAQQWSVAKRELLDHEENYALFRASLGNPGDLYLYHGLKMELVDHGEMDGNSLAAFLEEQRIFRRTNSE